MKTIYALLLMLALSCAAQAQTFTVLHTFNGKDGASPLGQLSFDSAGNLYGTTSLGGRGVCLGNGCGTVFRLNRRGPEFYSFDGAGGDQPSAGLAIIAAQGAGYGTTLLGGDTTCYSLGCGTVFKVDSSGQETVLHEFSGNPDGELPEAPLVADAAGNLYGTTYEGGAFDNAGVVFKLDSKGSETILHSFCSEANCTDGDSPYSGMILDSAGNLYGATAYGGEFCCGVVYKIDPVGTETVLYSFTGFSDGNDPQSMLLMDGSGNLYGTTREGGNGECGGSGCGVVFKLSPSDGGSWTESVLYTFCSLSECADGEWPRSGPLVIDAAGDLYGTTIFGGSDRSCNGDACGVVFKLDASGQETVLHSFTGGTDGATPQAGLVADKAGNLYGTAASGGDRSCLIGGDPGCGVVFKIIP
jgi:uncharacterized repeat protein (TIGR03803 family)